MKVMDNSYFLLKKEIVIVSKSELLNALFIEWRQKQINEPKESLTKTTLKNVKAIKYNFFCEDGIICEEQFEKEKIKVLFISNESNTENKSNFKNGQSPSPESSRIKDFEEYFNSHKDDWSGKMRKRICEILYAALMDLSETEFPVADGWKNAKKIAFMNLNKRGGKGSIENHLYHYCKYYKQLILKEINIINPDIIVWIGKSSFNMCAQTVFGKDNIENKGDCFFVTINCDDTNKLYPLICTFHTSSRISNIKRAKDIQNKYKNYLETSNNKK